MRFFCFIICCAILVRSNKSDADASPYSLQKASVSTSKVKRAQLKNKRELKIQDLKHQPIKVFYIQEIEINGVKNFSSRTEQTLRITL